MAYEHEFEPAWLAWRGVDKALDSMNCAARGLRGKGHAIARVTVALS